jgi:hypothetical protein
MGSVEDPFKPLLSASEDSLALLSRRSPSPVQSSFVPALNSAATARLHGFGYDEQPIISAMKELPEQLIAARTTIALRRDMIGAEVVVLFERGDPQRPIIIGVVQLPCSVGESHESTGKHVTVQADDERVVLCAEREIVLRCGEASITLTRAGKVIIKGTYVLSRSSGYNKIKGAAVDIN